MIRKTHFSPKCISPKSALPFFLARAATPRRRRWLPGHGGTASCAERPEGATGSRPGQARGSPVNALPRTCTPACHSGCAPVRVGPSRCSCLTGIDCAFRVVRQADGCFCLNTSFVAVLVGVPSKPLGMAQVRASTWPFNKISAPPTHTLTRSIALVLQQISSPSLKCALHTAPLPASVWRAGRARPRPPQRGSAAPVRSAPGAWAPAGHSVLGSGPRCCLQLTLRVPGRAGALPPCQAWPQTGTETL